MQSMLEFNPAQNLMEKGQLEGGWTVVCKIPRDPESSGGTYSVGYIVKNGHGKRAFLKALDFSFAMKHPDFTTVLQSLTSAYNYERTLLDKCRERNLDRVAVSIDHGQISAGDLHQSLPVPYMIFDLADGDIRSRLDGTTRFELAFILRALHHCATGIGQLHTLRVAHQDLKPSNVLIFDDVDFRVSDLGRSTSQDSASSADEDDIAGDATYAPPELLYGDISNDWRVRRLACDVYHIGSLAVYLFARVGITTMWHEYLDRSFWHECWGDSYREVLPYVRDAHDMAFREFDIRLPEELRIPMGQAVRQLCEPDPHLRGHPRSNPGNRYSLERYISLFNLLASRAEWQMGRSSS